MHDGFEERGTRCFHGFLESERTGDAKCHVGRINVVVFAVVEGGAEIGDREPGEEAEGGCFTDAALDGGNPVFGDGAAENVVDEFDALAAFHRLELDAADAELAVAAGLFLVLAFGVGLAADGFSVGNLGRLQREVDVVTLLHFGDNDFDVLLAAAGEEEFLCLGIARETERGIFFHDFVDGDADFVFIGAGFGFDGEGDGRLGKFRRRVINWSGFVAQRVAGDGLFEFGDGADVSSVQLLNFGELFALNDHGVLKALGNVAIEIVEGGVVFEDAAFHLEIVDAAGEGVSEGFESEDRERLGVVVFAIDAVALGSGFLEAELGVLIGMGEYIGEEGEQAGAADVAGRGNHKDRHNFFRDDGFTDGWDQVLDRNGAFAEKLLHHFVVALGDHFDQALVSFFGFVFQGVGNIFDGGLAVAVGRVHVGFHGDEIDHAAETFFGADGHLERDDGAAKNLDEGFEGALKAGEIAIHPSENEGAGNIVFGAIVPDFFGGDLRADVGVDGDKSGIDGDERGFCFGDESGVAGEIEEIDFDGIAGAEGAGPFGVGDTGLNGNFAGDFFFVPIGGGGAFRNFAEAWRDSGGIQ